MPYKADPYPSADIPVEAHGQRRCRLIGLKISDFGGGSEEHEPKNIFIAIRHVFLSQCMHEYLISWDLYINNQHEPCPSCRAAWSGRGGTWWLTSTLFSARSRSGCDKEIVKHFVGLVFMFGNYPLASWWLSRLSICLFMTPEKGWMTSLISGS